ncbi:MAG TPA: VOC family protein [Candidatus Binataceae bacterium]|nr:VOC family protein [Candidatus Binataceae bacterium]
MLKRLHTLTVAAADVGDAAATYSKNFGFSVSQSRGGKSATVRVGDAEIKLVSAAAAGIEKGAEGMIGLWLEAEDLDQVVMAFKRSGLETGPMRKAAGWRFLEIDPKLANQVPLFIFDRK